MAIQGPGQGQIATQPLGTGNLNGVASANTGNIVGVYGVTDSFDRTAVEAEGPAMPSKKILLAKLAGKDPVFHQLAGVFGVSDNQGVMGLTSSNSGTGVYGGNMDAPNGFGVRGETMTGVGVEGVSFGSGIGVAGKSKDWQGVSGVSTNQAGVVGTSTNFVGVWGESQSDTQPGVFGKGPVLAGRFSGNVEVSGNLNMTSGTSDIILGDVAEGFSTEGGAIVEPGTVVVLNEDGLVFPGEKAYDKKVAGVVSGAGGYRPAIILDPERMQTGQLPVALMGKVCCKVDAQYSPIEVGDLLTTSPTPGHAMKATDPLKAFGSVIGKALRPLNAGQGMIPVLIALQ